MNKNVTLYDVLRLYDDRIVVYVSNELNSFGYKYLMIYDFADENINNREILKPYLQETVLSIEPGTSQILNIILKCSKLF